MEYQRGASAAEAARAAGRGEAVGRPPTSAATLLMLQRTAGNAAGNRMLRGGRAAPPPRRPLQRFVGWEHQRLGDKGSAQTLIEVAPGVKLSWGQVVALGGDEFGTRQPPGGVESR